MAVPDLHRLILSPLHRTGVSYMITGGVAAIAYGEPRLTNDVDVVLAMTGDDAVLDAWAFRRRHTEAIGGDHLWFAPIEYAIVRKLEYYAQGGSDRHLRDVSVMLRISGDAMDATELRKLVAERGLERVWDSARTYDKK